MAESVLVASVFGLFLRAFLLSAVIVESRSMAPTLNPGDRVLGNRFVFSAEPSAWLASRSPRPGDIVALLPHVDPAVEAELAARGAKPLTL